MTWDVAFGIAVRFPPSTGNRAQIEAIVRRGRGVPPSGGGLALCALQNSFAVPVGPLVCEDVLRALPVALVEHGSDLGDRELVVPRPRLLGAK